MEPRPLSYYMGLDYTSEITREHGTVVGRVRELPGCSASVDEDEPVGQLWDALEEAKKGWLEGAIRERRWIPEPPHAEKDELLGLSEFFEEAQLDANDAREILYERGVALYPIPLLQEMWFRELGSEALRRVTSSLSAAPKAVSRRETPGRALAGNVRPLPLGNSGKVAWLRLDGERTEQGYREMEVLDQPLVTETAIISALTVLEAAEMGKEELEAVLRRVRGAADDLRTRAGGSVEDSLDAVFTELLDEWYANARLKGLSYAQVRSLRWSLALLRYRRPGFGSLPFDEQLALFERHCGYANRLLQASRKHAAFLEYGGKGGVPTRTVEKAGDQVRAALLADVGCLPHKGIAERMGLPVPQKYEINMEIPEVKDLVRDGRALLKSALGDEGWRERTEKMRKDAERFLSLEEQERDTELVAERTGVSKEKIRSLKLSSRGRIILDLLKDTASQ